MPQLIHEFPVSTWLNDVIAGLREQIDAIGLCEEKVLDIAGSPTCRFKTHGSVPDNSIVVGKPDQLLGDKPRVVIEVANSQTEANVMKKIWRYLHRTNLTIHAVILCTLTYPIPKDKTFKAEIGVWVRPRIDDMGE
jgi:hypothetical protein